VEDARGQGEDRRGGVLGLETVGLSAMLLAEFLEGLSVLEVFGLCKYLVIKLTCVLHTPLT
jgi:hypothetical protein